MKSYTVAFMKARNSFIARCKDKRVNWKKEQRMVNFFAALAKRFWLTSKSCSWFNKVVAKSGFDVQYVKRIPLEMIIGQQSRWT